MKSRITTARSIDNTFIPNPYDCNGLLKVGLFKEWDEEWHKKLPSPDDWKIKDIALSVPQFVIGLGGTTKDVTIAPGIKRVIFDPPYTIVYWKDGTNTIVKCAEGDIFNESAGVALCFMKRFCKDYYKPALKNAIKTAERPRRKAKKIIKKTVNPTKIKFMDIFKDMADAFAKFVDKEVKKNGTNENVNDKGNK